MIHPSRRFARIVLTVGVWFAFAANCGCDSSRRELDSTYGLARGRSVNGTAAFAEMLRLRGHKVIVSRRLNDDLKSRADAIVRFAPIPGPPELEEANWYAVWLSEKPSRALIYIPRDFDAETEYWESVLAALPKNYDPKAREMMDLRRNWSNGWYRKLPPPAKRVADPTVWFKVEPRKRPATCSRLEGDWAEGIDAQAAALTIHQPLEFTGDYPLLVSSADGGVLAMEWTWDSGSRVLTIANGSFLLNEPIARAARRPLANRTIDWLGAGKKTIVFAEGSNLLSAMREPPSAYRLLFVDPIGWVTAHLIALLIIGALSRAAILGRPRPDPPAEVDRPSAHPEAIGLLLSQTKNRTDASREQLEAYRRWRRPSLASSRSKRRPKR